MRQAAAKAGLSEEGSLGGEFAVGTAEGIYWFSSAVWLTLIISAVVSYYDEELRWKLQAEADAKMRSKSSIESHLMMEDGLVGGGKYLGDGMKNELPPSAAAGARSLLSRSGAGYISWLVIFLFTLFTTAATGFGAFLPIVERTVPGTISELWVQLRKWDWSTCGRSTHPHLILLISLPVSFSLSSFVFFHIVSILEQTLPVTSLRRSRSTRRCRRCTAAEMLSAATPFCKRIFSRLRLFAP